MDLTAGQTVTLLFTDIERSTELLVQLADRYAQALDAHTRILTTVIEEGGGEVVSFTGDGVCALFEAPDAALVAALRGQEALSRFQWPDDATFRVRMGVHSGTVRRSASGLVGLAVHVAARVAAVASGEQVVVTEDVRRNLADPGVATLVDLGRMRLRYVPEPQRLYWARPLSAPSSPPVVAAPIPPVESITRLTDIELVAWVEGAMSGFYGPNSETVLARLDPQWPTLCARIDGLVHSGPSELTARMVTVMAPYAVVARGAVSQARMWVSAVLGGAEPNPTVTLLLEAGRAVSDTGDLHLAATLLEDALVEARDAGDVVPLARSLCYLGELNRQRGDLGGAARLGLEAHQLETAGMKPSDRRLASHLLGMVAFDRGQLAESRAWFSEALLSSERRQDNFDVAGDLCNLCEVATVERDLDTAHAYLRRVETIAPQLPIDFALYQTVGARAALAVLEGRTDDAEAAYREYESLTDRTHNLVEHASALDGLGAVAALRGDYHETARRVGAAAAIRSACGTARSPIDKLIAGRHEEAAVDALGPATYRKSWRQGALTATAQ